MVKNLQFEDTEYRNLKSHSPSPGGYWTFFGRREKTAVNVPTHPHGGCRRGPSRLFQPVGDRYTTPLA